MKRDAMNPSDDKKRTLKVIEAVYEGMNKVIKLAGDDDFGEYVAFVTIGRVIAAKHGLARLLDYLSEINANNPLEPKQKKETLQ